MGIHAERAVRPFLWQCRVGPLRGVRLLQRRAGVEDISCRYFGARFTVDLRDEVGFGIATGRYEHTDICRFIAACERIKPALFIDVGANLGVYTCIVGIRRLAARTVALEPDPDNFSRLKANVVRNRLSTRTDLLSVAAGSRPGVVGLSQPDITNRGLVRVCSQAGGQFGTPMQRLDDLIRARGQPIALKIDVEGFEVDALGGAQSLLSENFGYAQIEGIGQNTTSIMEQMQDLGWGAPRRNGINLMFVRTRS